MILVTENEWHLKSFAEIRTYIFGRYLYPRDAAEKLMEIYYDISLYVESLPDTLTKQELYRWHTFIQQVEELRNMYEQMAIHGNGELPPVPQHTGRAKPTKQGRAEPKTDVEPKGEKVATPIVHAEGTVIADGVRYFPHDVVGIKDAAKILGYSVLACPRYCGHNLMEENTCSNSTGLR
ncbi:MAG TPA: hypothetical protein VHI13_06825 [Candidatus Kapabacteria bacterium]|nr:hypothetical protein [Candidatus Kapabacteria bacterium]